MAERVRVFVSGMGAVSPVGCGVAQFWRAVCEGQSGLAPIQRFDASPFRNRSGGEVKDFDAFSHRPEEPQLPRATAFAIGACREAFHSSGLPDRPVDPNRIGVVLGTNFGNLEELNQFFAGNRSRLQSYHFQFAVDAVCRDLGLRGPAMMLSLSCACGVAVIGCAMDWVRTGRADVVVACGFDELSMLALTGLNALRTITPDTVRPFDKRRAGTLFAEGAGALVVESNTSIARRGVSPVVELLGYGVNNDAFHMTAPDQSGRGIIEVMQRALQDARVEPERIEHINAHGTGTQYNDKIETMAIKAVFGRHAYRMPVVSLKGTLGHTMGAAGALETIAAALTIRDGIVPPTIGLQIPDPDCDLDYVPGSARKVPVRTVLSNSYGIGGTNAAIVLAAPEEVT